MSDSYMVNKIQQYLINNINAPENNDIESPQIDSYEDHGAVERRRKKEDFLDSNFNDIKCLQNDIKPNFSGLFELD